MIQLKQGVGPTKTNQNCHEVLVLNAFKQPFEPGLQSDCLNTTLVRCGPLILWLDGQRINKDPLNLPDAQWGMTQVAQVLGI